MVIFNPTKSSFSSPSSSLSPPSRRPSFRLRSPSLNSVRLRRIFDIFDQNHDGEITLDELSLALRRLGLVTDLHDLSLAIAAHIPPGRSGLAFPDFENLHRDLAESLDEIDADGAEESEMEEAFRVFDEDGDGFISAEELRAVLEKLGLPEGKNISRVCEMICSVDRNRDGRVDFVEFKFMMQGISVRTG